MYQSLGMKKKSPPKVKLTQTNAHLNQRAQQSISVEGPSTGKASVQKKISVYSPVQQKKIKDFFSFNEQRIKAKSMVINYVENVMKIASLSDDIFKDIEDIGKSQTFEQMVEGILKTLFHICEDEKNKHLHKYLQKERSKQFEKEVSLMVRKKQAQLLRILKDEEDTDQNQRSKSRRKYDEMYSAHQIMKKQIFQLRQEKLQLQKKILQIIEQFKNRKAFYLAQIKKLTDIINMSSFDVRTLILEKTKQAKYLESKLDQGRSQGGSAIDIITNQREAHQTQQTVHLLSPSSNNLTFNQYRPQSAREDKGIYNGYNTEIKILKGISSIQKMEQVPHDNYISY